jgi:hypothetical protein
MLPYSILSFVLAGSFLFTWAYVVWLEYKVNVDAARRDGAEPSGVEYFGGGSVGRTCDAPRAIRSKTGTRRRTLRVGARSAPAAVR